MTGMIDAAGAYGGPALDNNGTHYSWETYPERLEKAYGHFLAGSSTISTITTATSSSTSPNVRAFRQRRRFTRTPSRIGLSSRAAVGPDSTRDIPQVTWIVPPSILSEHPDYLPAAGEDHTSRVLDALWSNPALWARTLVILNYDENDGFFDHVAPPVPEPGAAGEFVNGLPVGLGFRVPCLLISPFTRGGYVCGETFDHTSTLRLIEARFGVEVPNLSPWRLWTSRLDLIRALGFGMGLGGPTSPTCPRRKRRSGSWSERRHDAAAPPSVPALQAMPKQEPGSRPRRG